MSKRSSTRNLCYISFLMNDHVYMATCYNYRSLVHYLLYNQNKAVDCVGIDFVRGSRYFQRQIKQLINATFGKCARVFDKHGQSQIYTLQRKRNPHYDCQ